MRRFVLVLAGGALGSGARYLVAVWAAGALTALLPIGTALVNVTGSFFIAVVLDLALRAGLLSPDLRMFLATGVAGGYTTYSSLDMETLVLVQRGSVGLAAVYFGGTAILCAVAGGLGMAASRAVTGTLAQYAARGWR